ncbi:hypothetical protein J2T09_005376 [Neorhizobium huautlense]|uniref:Uncharacterized protein n=1 Tax=Neorhizobium huautlense TaxID=67774 RepID=A0ABT9Q2N6_9HYPH|nr:hypothetical protein [Neorhizobium huautlense]MDP9840588.1 hypothetical protein [Neorhizobium huautlense]
MSSRSEQRPIYGCSKLKVFAIAASVFQLGERAEDRQLPHSHTPGALLPRYPASSRTENAEKVSRAISDAVTEVATNVRDAGLSFEPTSEGYLMFAVQQATFVRLCGGDPDTLRGGNPEVGDHVVQNCRNIIDTYWKSQSAHTTTP